MTPKQFESAEQPRTLLWKLSLGAQARCSALSPFTSEIHFAPLALKPHTANGGATL